MTEPCVIALDLGTTAFKCAPVNEHGVLAEATTVPYDLDYDAGLVTCRAEVYERAACEALSAATKSAANAGLTVTAIGISSQAQTYLPLDRQGAPLQSAVVWTDGRAVDEAREAAEALPGFAHHSGFRQPLAAMFMPKIKYLARHGSIPLEGVWKFALLNEYIIYRLTGAMYGDTTNQGMSGFYHIANRCWSRPALEFAGLHEDQLAQTAPGGTISRPLSGEWRQRLGIAAVPVYSCGNDQSCSAAGAGLAISGEILCNFGTAMVLYALQDELPDSLRDKQIAGINPLTGRYFLLGLDAECGNVLDWAHRTLYRGQGFTSMMEEGLQNDPHATLPRIALPGGGIIDITGLTVGCQPRHIVHALLEMYADDFGALLADLPFEPARRVLYASGGLSRSAAWLNHLSQRYGLEFKRTSTDQPGLVGVARIIQRGKSQ
jgi:sugar (pentulose or hexulose) kinase